MRKASYLDLMVDNETLATTADAVILSIGAVRFHKDTIGAIGEKFYAVLDIEDQKERGRFVDPETVAWWDKQSPEARKVLETTDRRPVKEVLNELWDFIFDIDQSCGEVRLWGNGSDFDNPQIASLFRMYGFETPWKFWNNRCFRTLKSEFGHLLDKKPVRKGTYHNALDDAIHQADHCQHIFAALKKQIILHV